MPIATNPDTGESVFLDDTGQWKPAPRAINPETQEELAFDGKSWTSLTPKRQPANQPSLPPTDASTAFGRGFTGAGSFGFRDEGSGLIAAGGGDPDNPDPAHALSSLAVGAYRRLTGDPEAEQRYNTEVDRQRTQAKQLEAEHPVASIGGQVAGAVALPLPALRAATIGGRIGQGAAIGAGTGALSGLGEGEDTLGNRVRSALFGGTVGGIAGGAAVPVVEGLTAGARYLAGKPIALARSAYNPEGQAERAIGRSYAEAVSADPAAANRLAPGALSPGDPTNPAVVLDVLGQPGRNLARSAANLSGEARDVLEATLEPRTAGQSHRLSDWFQTWMRHPDMHAAQEAIDLAERTGNRTNYNAAMRQGDFPIRSDLLERLTSAGPVQRAMRDAAEAQNTRAVSEGFGGFRSPVTITPDGQVTFNRGPNGVPTFPNLQFWDATRKQISDAARVAARAGRNEDASVLGNLARTINNELDAIVPSYATARQGAAKFFGEENALAAGRKFVKNDYNLAETRATLAKMSDAERKLFEDGFASGMIEELGKHERVMSRTSTVQRLFDSPTARQRIDMVLGKDRANELRAALHVENIMNQADRAVRGNSTTAQQLVTAGLAGATGGAGGYYAGDFTGSSTLGAVVSAFARHKLDQRVAAHVAKLVLSNDPKVIDRGIKMIARNERFMRVLQEADSALARIGGTQAGSRAP